MKIDTDLRLAIKAAEKAQSLKRRYTWSERQEQENKNVNRFLSKTQKGRLAVAMRERYNNASKILEEVGQQLGAMGLSCNANGIYLSDRERFIKAGGTAPVEEGKPWVAEYVMAEIAKAEPAEAKKILKRIGINWS